MGSLGCIVVALMVLVASALPKNAEAAAMPEEQGNHMAAGGPSLGTPKHTLRRRAVPLPPATNVSLAPLPDIATGTPKLPEIVAETVPESTGTTVDPTGAAPFAPMEQGATNTPSEGMESEVTQESHAAGMTSGITEMPPDATDMYSEFTDAISVSTEKPPEGTSSTLDVTWAPPETTSPATTNTPEKTTWRNQETEMPTVATTQTKAETTNFTTSAETTVETETDTPKMTEPSTYTAPVDTSPVSQASPSSPFTQSPMIENPTTPQTQSPSTSPTQRPASRFPNLPYMPNPMVLPMGLDEFMGRIGATRTSSRPATPVAIAGLPSLSKPMNPVPLL